MGTVRICFFPWIESCLRGSKRKYVTLLLIVNLKSVCKASVNSFSAIRAVPLQFLDDHLCHTVSSVSSIQDFENMLIQLENLLYWSKRTSIDFFSSKSKPTSLAAYFDHKFKIFLVFVFILNSFATFCK